MLKTSEAPIDRLRQALPDALIILTAHEEMQRAADAAFPFVQEASFRWLTGIVEAGWWAIVTPQRYILIAPERDETKQLFEGGLTHEAALAQSGADTVVAKKDAEATLYTLAQEYSTVYTVGDDPYRAHYSFTLNPAQARLAKALKKHFDQIEDCRPHLARLRAEKTMAEQATIQKAVDITLEGFAAAKKGLSDVKAEYEIEAQLSYQFRTRGADGHAYDPIVASGAHACTLHYGQNNDPLEGKRLVLIDAGASVGGYAADITRTWAIGTPTKRERAVHAAVEAAHKKIIALIQPERTFASYQKKVDEIMKDALVSLGLLKDRDDTATYRTYFPHAVSHGLGLDVHESLGGNKAFKPGMVLTVEPGIYIPEEGIGVRIEDDILVTKTGHKNLSAALPTSL